MSQDFEHKVPVISTLPKISHISKRMRVGSVLAALTVPFVGGAEGLRQISYPDPASHGVPWTICYGHTEGVEPHQHASVAQCADLLRQDLGKEAVGLDRCIKVDTTDGQAVALLSLSHNIGVAGACKSSVVRDLNAGRVQQACDDLLKFNRAAGVVFPGLTRRRVAERALCLEK